MNIGGLYEIKKWYWLLFPSKDMAADASADVATPYDGVATGYAGYWSREFNCNVSFVPQNSIFVLLEQHGKFCKVLSTDGQLGWIIYPENEVWAKDCFEQVEQ